MHRKPVTKEELAARRETIIKKYGSWQAYTDMLRAAQKKSRLNYKGDGGMRALTPERRREISKLGNQKRWGHETENNQSAKETS